jgi:TRAP-type C4-dicarboxylate transport system permease small subunit
VYYLYNIVKKINTILIEKLCVYLSLFLLALITIVVILQVFFRFVIQLPLSWSDELSRYLLIYLACFSSVIAFKKGNHICLDFFSGIYKKYPFLNKIFQITLSVAIVFFSVVMIKSGIVLCKMMAYQYSPSLKISMQYPYFSWIICSALIIFNFVEVILKTLFKFE